MSPLVERVGWMLVHSVWEGALVWIALQVALRALVGRSPQSRYLAACLALAAMAVLPWLTFGTADLSARLRAEAVSVSASAPATPSGPTVRTGAVVPALVWVTAPVSAPQSSLRTTLTRWLPALVAAWMAGLVLSLFRLGAGWRRVQGLLRLPLPPLPQEWEERFARLVALSGVRQAVRFGEAAAVAVPVVAGWLKPVILLPLGVLASLPPEQVEAILLHELAHLARRDYLANLLQSVVETVFFFHPAAWSIGRRIRLERELACDDLAVAWCASPQTYAEALAGFEGLRAAAPLLAATGGGDLLARVRRILRGPSPQRRGLPSFALAACGAVGLYFASMFLCPLLAQEAMTAAERMSRIEALQPTVSPGNIPSSGEFVTISGTLNTEDGAPLPASLLEGSVLRQSQGKVASWHLGGSMSNSIAVRPSDRTFDVTTMQGQIGIGIWAEGYAPLRRVGLDGKEKLALVLHRGFPGLVQVADEAGHPIAEAQIAAVSTHAGEPLDLAMPPVRTDAAGGASFGHVEVDSEIHLTVSKDGWQMMERHGRHWTPGNPVVVRLQPSWPTSGRVIDRTTGQPIADAEIRLAGKVWEGRSNYTSYPPQDAMLLGHSGSDGHFDLTGLAGNFGYYIYVQAKGYALASFPIHYADRDRVCELTPSLRLHGKILDPEGRLKQTVDGDGARRDDSPVQIFCSYAVSATPFNSYGVMRQQAVPFSDKEMSFAFDDLPAGDVELQISRLDHSSREIFLSKNVDDYVMDLSAAAQKPKPADPGPLRPVEITLKTPDGIMPEGSVKAEYDVKGERGLYLKIEDLPLQQGVAKVDVPVSGTVTLRADRLIGYWFPPTSVVASAGTEPLPVMLNAIPAGVIHGKVALPPPMQTGPASFAVIPLTTPHGVTVRDLQQMVVTNLPKGGDYVTVPLPFGGTYAVLINGSPTYFLSPPFVVDAAHPLVLGDFAVPDANGFLGGRFVDEKGQPIPYQQVWMTYVPMEGCSFSSYATITQENGTFLITKVNLDLPGHYEVQLEGTEWETTPIPIDAHTTQPISIPARRRAK